MRIISGKFRGKKINLPNDKTTRPLRDLVKEALFNVIEHSNKISFSIKNSTVLDLFSGSGSFGLEAISRGGGRERGTEWEDWDINIREGQIVKEEVPIVNRGHNAIIEATVIASRLRISQNREKDLQKIESLLKIAEKCGNVRDCEAKVLVERLVFQNFEGDKQRKKF